jgi:hypothetical protein
MLGISELGCTPSEIAGVLGHKTLAMVKRYAHLNDAHIDGVVQRMVAANITEAWESSRSSSSTPSTGDNVLSLDIASRKRGTA